VKQDNWLEAWTSRSAGSSGVDCSGDLAAFPTTGDRMLMRAASPYSRDDVVYVAQGETLVIEPGVVVFGSVSGTLIVSRAGRIEAVGTADEPIVFTSAPLEGEQLGGNNLSGLTLVSVGSGTSIHYIQVNSSVDDCFEWFG
jgi:hypothetical protein